MASQSVIIVEQLSTAFASCKEILNLTLRVGLIYLSSSLAKRELLLLYLSLVAHTHSSL